MLLSGMTPYDTVKGELLGGWEGGKARKAPAITSPVSETIEHVPRDSGVSGLFGMRRVKEPMSWAASEEPGGPACPAAAAASASGVADDDVLQDFHQIWVGTGKPRAFVLLQAEMSLASATPLRLFLPRAAAARPGEGREAREAPFAPLPAGGRTSAPRHLPQGKGWGTHASPMAPRRADRGLRQEISSASPVPIHGGGGGELVGSG